MIKFMTTGVALDSKTLKQFKQLGAKEASDIRECTHLVATRIVRTEKMLAAIALCTYIVSEKWIFESVKCGRILGMR